jgi:uncharacterized radical SAM protein YgiQ
MTGSNLSFLPTSADEMRALGWSGADIIIVSGDAYIDHPSFGTAVMARLGEYTGLKVAVLPQPNWRDDLRDFKKLGKPRLFFGVTAGSMDSMVNHYTARKRLRSDDAYTPGGRPGFRPDYATVVYTKILKHLFPDTVVILGGIEASLRRITHYDYWSDALKPSFLAETGADMILYGMAERSFIDLIQKLQTGTPFQKITDIPQTAFLADTIPANANQLILASHEECMASKRRYANMFRFAEKEFSSMKTRQMIQQTGTRYVVINPPHEPPSENETDLPFDLPYTRLPHPRYRSKPPVPAYEMIKNSVTIHRGCFGGCSFCAISAHQGKFISSRSEKSVLSELKTIASAHGFKGHITDLGGPSANMYQMKGIDTDLCMKCKRPSCIFPQICNNLSYDHHPLLNLYKKAGQIQGIKLITIGSGIRYDMLTERPAEEDRKYGLSEYVKTLILKHVSGRLKVAPEHVTEQVLSMMRKPQLKNFIAFHKLFHTINKGAGLKQEMVLYLISGHPGSSNDDLSLLKKTTASMGYRVETIQEFTPTPMTLSSVMYYTGIDPNSEKKVSVPMSGKISASKKLRKQ